MNSDIFNKSTATDAGFDVHAVFDVLLKVFGFFRQIIDFMKGILTPVFADLFSSLADKVDEATQ